MDKVAIVTGASRGLGLSIATKLHDRNYKLGVCARRTPEIPGLTVDNSVISGIDVCNVSHVKGLISRTYMKFGRIDVLINNAAYSHPLKDLEDITNYEADQTLRTNILAPFYFMKLVIPIMKKQRHGMIINVCSRSGTIPNSRLPIYSASKAGLSIMSDAINKSLEGTGVTCLTVAPGAMNTQMRQELVGDAAGQTPPEHIADIIIGMIERY
jgi:short-subunit dehydrogenase